MLEIRPLGLDGVVEIRPPRITDSRGFFSETYNANSLEAAGVNVRFVQDNHSYSAARGVLRGLHYQLPPAAQQKLVRVVKGAILDVAVDIRKSSPTFGKWVSLELSADQWNQILIPEGFAHGFITLTDDTEVIYKVSAPYAPTLDRGIRFDDPELAITWPISAADIQVSDKDRVAPYLANAQIFD